MYSPHPPRKPPVNHDKTKYDVFSFRWADTEFTPKQLESLLGRRVPYLIMTTQGYLGRDEYMNAVAADEVYWLREVAKQPRIVVRSESGGYYSIPLNYPQLVIPIYADPQYINDEPMTIKRLVEEAESQRFLFVTDDNQTKQSVYQGPNESTMIKFGTVEIIDQYDEKYLVAHTLSGGTLYHDACVIPLYMPITLVIGVGMARGDHSEFYEAMLKMKAFIDSVPPDMKYPRQLRETSDILMYEGKPEEGEYDMLEPLKYVSLHRGENDKRQSAMYASLLNDESPYVLENAYATAAEIFAAPKEPVAEKNKKKKNLRSKFLKGTKSKNSKPSAPAISPSESIEESRGGVRGPDTNIAIRRRCGYHLSDLDPQDILAELQHVLETGEVPNESQVLNDLWTDSEGEEESRKRNYPNQKAPRWASVEDHDRDSSVAKPLKVPTRPVPRTPPEPPGHDALPNEYSSLELNRVSSSMKESRPVVPGAPWKLPSKPPMPTPGSEKSGAHTLKDSQGNGENLDLDMTRMSRAGPAVHPKRNPPPILPKSKGPNRQSDQPEPAPIRTTSTQGPPGDTAISVIDLNVAELGEWLSSLHLEKYRAKFEQEQIDGSLLLDMDTEMLQEELGFNRFEACKLIKFAKDGWRPNTNK